MRRPLTLTELRERRGLLQADVARRLNVNRSVVTRLESCDAPGVETLDRAVAAMGGRLLLVAVFEEDGRAREYPLRLPGDRRPPPEREPPPPPDVPQLDDPEPLAFPDLSAF